MRAVLSPAVAQLIERRFKRHIWRFAAIAALTLLAMLHALGALPMAVLDQIDHWFYDTRLMLNLPAKGSLRDDRIVIVQVDERSLEALGQWPWRRDMVARMLDELHERQRVAAIGIDAVFAEAQSEPQPADAQQNSQLADALARSGTVVGYHFANARLGYRAGQLPAPVMPLPRPAPRGLLQWDGYSANLPVLMAPGTRAGFLNLTQDSDGQVRAAPLLTAFGDGIYESLALAVLRQALVEQGQEPVVRVRREAGQIAGFDLVGTHGRVRLSAPLDARGTALVPYRGQSSEADSGNGVFRYISAVDIYEGWLPQGSLAGRIVLIGCTAPGQSNLHVTPVDETYPGVEIQASLIAGMLDGAIPIQPVWTPVALALLLAAIGMATVCALLFWPMPARLLFGVGLLAALIGVNQWLYHAAHLALPMAPVIVQVFLIVLVNITLGYWQGTRAQRALVRQFAVYVPPELVRQMRADPLHYTMRARAEEVTVLFCDLRHFTRLAEGMDPLAVQALLSDVLGRLTQTIQAERGTIDKYMGDCVMAFWGAPVRQADHATRAVRAALAMREVMAQIDRERAAAGQPAIAVSIGINTGAVAVGDMGTSARRAYTVIGDTVNLASRLVQLTQIYGVELVVGETTREQATGWAWQELDRARVRGRQQTTAIYTPRAPVGALDAELDAELTLWQAALDDWRAQQLRACAEKIRRLRALAPEIRLYRLYEKRLNALESSPPPPPRFQPAPWTPDLMLPDSWLS